jgi:hypothetical protein
MFSKSTCSGVSKIRNLIFLRALLGQQVRVDEEGIRPFSECPGGNFCAQEMDMTSDGSIFVLLMHCTQNPS